MWEGRDDHGLQVATGVYFYRFQAGQYSELKRMLLLKEIMMKRTIINPMLAVAVLIGGAASALGVSPQINYQGILNDDTGNPLNGTYDITFRLCPASYAIDPLWMKTHSTQVTNGLVNVMLGSVGISPPASTTSPCGWASPAASCARVSGGR